MAISSPRDISGLVLWLSADAVTGLSDDTQMTAWSDLSGNSNNATGVATTTKPKWRSTAGSAGGPAVQFPNDGYFTLPNLISGASAGELMMSVRHNTPGNNGTGSWAFGADTGNNDECHYPYFGTVYESFGLATGGRKSFSPTLGIGSWRRYNIWSAANDWTARLDETTQLSSTSATVGWSSSPTVGAGRKSSAVDLRFDGWIGCVLLYNRKLTTGERSDLATWLASNPSGGNVASGVGTLAATESGDDVAALAGDVYVAGALAATEVGSDTAAIIGSVRVSGPLSAAESGADSAAIAGVALAQAALTASETGADSAAVVGTVAVSGFIAATETGSDSAAIVGDVVDPIVGVLAATESGADTASVVGVVSVRGSAAITETGADSAIVVGKVFIAGTLAANEAGQDTAAISDRVIPITVSHLVARIALRPSLSASISSDTAVSARSEIAPHVSARHRLN